MAIIFSEPEATLASSSSPIKVPHKYVSGATHIWARWQRRRRYRNDLKRLILVGPHMIEDIGLNLEEAQREARKAFWRA